MHESANRFFNEFYNGVELFWWSFIKAPAAFIAAWGVFSVIVHPDRAAAQTMEMARSGGMSPELMTGIVTAWFLCGCAAFSIAIFSRIVLKTKSFRLSGKMASGQSGFTFHPMGKPGH